MCPLRFILVFFSAILAGYLAWRAVSSSPETGISFEDSAIETKSSKDEGFNFKKMIQNGFWVFVDMASGKYMWRNLREMNREKEVKSS
ncbi:Methyltransferase-related protein [Quillaja saponaria]|uniref:Methyltransferase-related protein n=1 Tax=Quillaja saponaria TaxID=32244 RepID=A0AAD7Q7Q8_QUISA|nr:Methyltransferase-related protein [Quillaja saponaria]